jgi:tRNA-dihydrouridine synthase B
MSNDTNFWSKLPQPIIGLAPMDGVSDHPFRFIQKKYGQPALMYTEFTSVEGVCHGAQRLLEDFLYDETQRPIVAQIYGTTPDFFRQTAVVLCQLGFDGIDINMGCPAKNVAHSGAGAALIQTPKLAQDIIRATKQGIAEWCSGSAAPALPNIIPAIQAEITRRHQALPPEKQLRRAIPVSVKTRIGFSHPVVSTWIPTLLEAEPTAITLHGRTLKQQYSGLADWNEIGRAAEICALANVPLLGNGDVSSLDIAQQKISTYKTNGVLIARATFGNPWVFLPTDHPDSPHHPDKSLNEKMAQIAKVALEHAQMYEQAYSSSPRYHFLPMRKHLGWYLRGFPEASKIRSEVYQANSSDEVAKIFAQRGWYNTDTSTVEL